MGLKEVCTFDPSAKTQHKPPQSIKKGICDALLQGMSLCAAMGKERRRFFIYVSRVKGLEWIFLYTSKPPSVQANL